MQLSNESRCVLSVFHFISCLTTIFEDLSFSLESSSLIVRVVTCVRQSDKKSRINGEKLNELIVSKTGIVTTTQFNVIRI
jgi:hypothetical protein